MPDQIDHRRVYREQFMRGELKPRRARARGMKHQTPAELARQNVKTARGTQTDGQFRYPAEYNGVKLTLAQRMGLTPLPAPNTAPKKTEKVVRSKKAQAPNPVQIADDAPVCQSPGMVSPVNIVLEDAAPPPSMKFDPYAHSVQAPPNTPKTDPTGPEDDPGLDIFAPQTPAEATPTNDDLFTPQPEPVEKQAAAVEEELVTDESVEAPEAGDSDTTNEDEEEELI